MKVKGLGLLCQAKQGVNFNLCLH